jgi:hypothetical protein
MKAYGGVDEWSHIFFTSALAGGERSASRPCRFNPENKTRSKSGWVEKDKYFGHSLHLTPVNLIYFVDVIQRENPLNFLHIALIHFVLYEL